MLENQAGDCFPCLWVAGEWLVRGGVLQRKRENTVSCISSRRISPGRVFGLETSRVKKGCENAELECVQSSSINYTAV